MSDRPRKPPDDAITTAPFTSKRAPTAADAGRTKAATQRGHGSDQPTVKAGDGGFPDETIPTMIDPLVPTGAKDRPQQFDPHARIEDNRRPVGPGLPLQPAPIDPHVIAGPPPPAAPPRRAAKFDPSLRIDDSSRTAKYDPHNNPARNAVPPAAAAPAPEPLRVISMKTPMELEAEKTEKAARQLPVVQMRAMSEIRQTPPRGMGNLAPPRDPREARSRRVQDVVIWGSVAVMVASVVTLAIWFLAR